MVTGDRRHLNPTQGDDARLSDGDHRALLSPMGEPAETVPLKLFAAAQWLGCAGRGPTTFPEALAAARRLIDAAEAQWEAQA